MKYCADCKDMEGNVESHNKGMFTCYNPKSGFKVVSARKPACNYITECFNHDRCETDRERLMAKSREYRCYIVGAVVKTLNIDLDLAEYYLSIFDYFKNTIMPRINNGAEWVEDYDKFGPEVAAKIKGNEEKCEKLFNGVIKPFTDALLENEVDDAITIYTSMYSDLKQEYGIGEGDKELVQSPQALTLV